LLKTIYDDNVQCTVDNTKSWDPDPGCKGGLFCYSAEKTAGELAAVYRYVCMRCFIRKDCWYCANFFSLLVLVIFRLNYWLLNLWSELLVLNLVIFQFRLTYSQRYLVVGLVRLVGLVGLLGLGLGLPITVTIHSAPAFQYAGCHCICVCHRSCSEVFILLKLWALLWRRRRRVT